MDDKKINAVEIARKEIMGKSKTGGAQKALTIVLGLLAGVGIYTVVDWLVNGVLFLASLL